MWSSSPSLDALQNAISDASHPIGMRMRAAYFLRQAHVDSEGDNDKQQLVIDALSMGLSERAHGSLMRHEFAYVMGQLRDERCCPMLEMVLKDSTDCTMVRHEAAEALGAIGAKRSQRSLSDVMEANLSLPELSDTCRLALNYMKWREEGGDGEAPPACACMLNPYSSVDPAPPHPTHASLPFCELGDILCNDKNSMFERYRAMFSLRNRGGEEAVQQLCRALTSDTSSALLRHEVAYVLGQMQHPFSVEALEESLRRADEHEMVRHESAEALGAIDGRWEDVELILREFSTDKNVVVRESCLVALDAADYWGHSNVSVQEPGEVGSTSLCFVHQKNAAVSTDDSGADGTHTQEPALVNHFNLL